MTYNQTVNYYLKSNHMVLNKAAEGITHDESLRMPEETENNMNWILGHIIISRNGMCTILDHPGICDASFQKLYNRGTKPDMQNAVPFDELLATYNDSQNAIMEKVMEFDPLKEEKQSNSLTFLCFHEAYHVGQLGILRRMLGKEGVAG